MHGSLTFDVAAATPGSGCPVAIVAVAAKKLAIATVVSAYCRRSRSISAGESDDANACAVATFASRNSSFGMPHTAVEIGRLQA